ncbi:hypothetical protein QYE76_020988 [Lolium multiflorum]|uniref:Integrase catalytic domain-containing protein n=1 Tax=Lolium multiflorum TaxID=4521 RepID=A0AAD8VRU2_LOLMU|nr:hypothetical protein QYE76_020988 [Lolium multiflorum]
MSGAPTEESEEQRLEREAKQKAEADEATRNQFPPPPPPMTQENFLQYMQMMEERQRITMEQQNKFFHDLLQQNKVERHENQGVTLSTSEYKANILCIRARTHGRGGLADGHERKLNTVGCNDLEKVRYATHLLCGPAASWWDNIVAVYPADKVFTWDEFKRKFRESNVPESIVELKRREFESLEQKDKAILTYVREFSGLSRYAVEEVNTEDKKKKRFMQGLNPRFKVQLRMLRATEFQELVDASLLKMTSSNKRKRGRRLNLSLRGKANVVADALSRKSTGGIEQEISPELKKEISQAQIQLWEKEAHEGLSALQVADELNVNLKNEIIMGQLDDPFIVEEMRRIDEGRPSEFHRGEMGSLWFQKRICVPDIDEIKEVILREAHQTPYSIHPGSTKMYMDLKELFWWNNMKREIAQYVAECHTCQRVKAEHQSLAGKLQPLPIPEWKWEEIGMEFITGLPMTNKKKDMIWVIVDRLTKSAHFLAVNQQDKGEKLIDLYIKEIVSKHGVPKKIVSDRESMFTSAFWKQLHEALGSKLDYSTAYHPQTGGQTERTNQILQDMLRACALDFGGSWEEHLPLAEFSYNNSYQSSIKMAPFEALYGRKCRSPICWHEAGSSKEFNPDYVKEKQQIIDIIRDRLKIAQSRQKSYADQKKDLGATSWRHGIS